MAVPDVAWRRDDVDVQSSGSAATSGHHKGDGRPRPAGDVPCHREAASPAATCPAPPRPPASPRLAPRMMLPSGDQYI